MDKYPERVVLLELDSRYVGHGPGGIVTLQLPEGVFRQLVEKGTAAIRNHRFGETERG